MNCDVCQRETNHVLVVTDDSATAWLDGCVCCLIVLLFLVGPIWLIILACVFCNYKNCVTKAIKCSVCHNIKQDRVSEDMAKSFKTVPM